MPKLGEQPIVDITIAEILLILPPIEKRGNLETA